MPNGIESARAKIIRAMHHQEAIETAIAEYTNTHPYEKIVQSDGTTKLKITKQPPPIISILSGEVLYQLPRPLVPSCLILALSLPEILRIAHSADKRRRRRNSAMITKSDRYRQLGTPM